MHQCSEYLFLYILDLDLTFFFISHYVCHAPFLIIAMYIIGVQPWSGVSASDII